MPDNLRKWLQIAILCSLCLFLPGFLNAQISEIPNYMATYEMNSGMHSAPATAVAPVPVFADEVHVPQVPWLRIFFGDVYLGSGSYLQLTSLHDGARQQLDAGRLAQWNNTSAFFNGERIRVELFAAPGDLGVHFSVKQIMIGEWADNQPQPLSICGADDDRTASDDPKTGRIVPVGCTGWLITNGLQLTAGHCLDGTSAQVLQFNVPMSLPNGTIQHPGPEDQYSIIQSSRVYSNNGVGNDWGKFEVQNNSVTGLQPIEAQGAAFQFVQDYSPVEIRITGYGVDGPPPGHGNGTRDETNQTQQTHVGPNRGSAGTTMRYHTDTQGGNSGSPVIDDATGRAVGIHTHGGCTSSLSSSNAGTSFFHPELWEAINIADPEDPLPPTDLTAFSDNSTPTSAMLNWTDPTALVDGTPISPVDFTIEILRDGAPLTSVAGGTGLYEDTGLTTGQTYEYTLFTKLVSNDSTSRETSVGIIAGGYEALIWNPTDMQSARQIVERSKKDPRARVSYSEAVSQLQANRENVAVIADALTANGVRNLTVTTLPGDISHVRYLFVVLGHFSGNHVITSNDPDAQVIVNYIANGGHVYMEGGDVWFWDPGHGGYNFNPLFGINGLSDGAQNGELTQIVGADIAIGQDFDYVVGSDNYTDHITATGTGVIIHSNTSPAFDCGVANAAATNSTAGNTIGTSFQFKDLVDGNSPATRAELMETYLSFFGHSAETVFSMAIDDGWNMVGLPLAVIDSAGTTLFPNHTPNSLYSFNGTYKSETHLERGFGYWIRFDNPEMVSITGMPMDSHTLTLNRQWNMISGPSCAVPVAAIDDPDSIIIPGTFYTFDGAYTVADTLEPGKGYWVRAQDAGQVTIACSAPLGKQPLAAITAKLVDQPSILVKDARDNEQRLFIDARLPEGADNIGFTLPPVPPAPLFDVRFEDDSYLSESDQQAIRLQANYFPLTLQMTNLNGARYRIEALVGSHVVTTHEIDEGSLLTLENPAINRLQLSKTGEGMSAIPATFALLQNYPNPFNPTTQISYQLPVAGAVKLEIYNALGQLVKVLVDASQTAGYKTVEWDATNQQGAQVASGIYLYRLTAGDFTAMKKLILLR